MITASQIQKKLYELNDKSGAGGTLVINIGAQGFELATLSKEHVITRVAEIFFKDDIKDTAELSQYFTQFISEFDVNKKSYDSVYINWLSKHFTLVPASFYSSDKAKELLDFNIGGVIGEHVATNDVLGQIKLVYSIPAELKNNLDKLFPKNELKHCGSSSIQLFFTHFQLKNADVFLKIHPQSAELLIKKDKQLLMYNVYDVKSDEDILYYLLFSIEQFDLDPQSLKLLVAGNRETNDELFKTVKKYIRQVNFAVSDKMIVRKEAFESLPAHFYFTLLNRVLCE